MPVDGKVQVLRIKFNRGGVTKYRYANISEIISINGFDVEMKDSEILNVDIVIRHKITSLKDEIVEKIQFVIDENE